MRVETLGLLCILAHTRKRYKVITSFFVPAAQSANIDVAWRYSMYKTHFFYDSLTPEQAAETDAANLELYRDACEKWRAAVKALRSVMDENSKELRYILKVRIPAPRSYTQDLANIKKRKEEIARKAEQEAEAKEAERLRAEERIRKIVSATKLLLEHGIEPGTCPVGQADNLVYEREADKLRGTEMECDCDECGTWIVGEHRCTCGNRRVTLASDGDFEGMYFYAECY